jgi:uncharacterized membrane protein
MTALTILSRWVHVMSAVLAIGSTFFMRVILPRGLAQADAGSREAVFLRCRRLYKMLIHTCALLLILTGAFNSWLNWQDYGLDPKLMQSLWGTHVLLAAVAIVIAFVLLAGKQPPRWHKTGASVNLVVLFIVVLLASNLKFVRDQTIKSHPPATAPAASVNR